jgi:hypothetical protein
LRDVLLPFVRDVEGVDHTVESFIGKPRPPGIKCPFCSSPVFLRLGEVLRPHAAHAPNPDCYIQRAGGGARETLEHEHAKLLLAETLGKRQSISFWHLCFNHCGATVATVVEGFDSAEAEVSLDSGLRPDVLLSRGGAPVLALEVYVSHRVPDSKVGVFSSSGMSWAEISASDAVEYCQEVPPAGCSPSAKSPIRLMAGSFKKVCRDCSTHMAKMVLLPPKVKTAPGRPANTIWFYCDGWSGPHV